MNRRNFLTTAAASLGSLTLAGCMSRSAVHSDVQAVAQVVEREHNDDGSVTAIIEVTSDDPEGGTVGLHVHYFHGGHCNEATESYHTHMPSVYVPSGETVTIRDTYKHGGDVGCISAHVHK